MSDSQFQKAVEIIRSLPKDSPAKVTQAQQVKIYGLYKQATEGDVSTSRPGMLDFTGRAKWYVTRVIDIQGTAGMPRKASLPNRPRRNTWICSSRYVCTRLMPDFHAIEGYEL